MRLVVGIALLLIALGIVALVGGSFSATTTAPVPVGDPVAIPTARTVQGHVSDVSPATKGLDVSEKGGGLVLSFDKVTTPGGVSTPMSATLSRVARSGGKTAGIIEGSAAGTKGKELVIPGGAQLALILARPMGSMAPQEFRGIRTGLQSVVPEFRHNAEAEGVSRYAGSFADVSG